MNCMNCGTHLAETDLEYCPRCGFHVRIQRKVDYLSRLYYNRGLEKATIRDLSGAINCLKQSLSYNKNNIEARNLLGLVYFETGEVVAALSEWVISKNLQPRKNLASEYIDRLQANPAKLDAINDTIKKYNQALSLCREGHDDMAGIALRRILMQNSKLIKGYHLLALIQMKNHEWNRARRTLKRAARIDKTNTTTLRFLKEVDERTGVTTRLEEGRSSRSLLGRVHLSALTGRAREKEELFEPDIQVEPTQTVGRSGSYVSLFLMLAAGIGVGILAFYLLIMPAIRQGIYRQANDQIVRYSESVASQSSELSRVQGEAQESTSTALATAQELDLMQKRSESLQYLLSAYTYYVMGDNDSAAGEIKKVYLQALPEENQPLYHTISGATGVKGIEEGTSEGEESGSVSEEGYEDGSYDESSYDYDDNYDDYYDDNYNYDSGY